MGAKHYVWRCVACTKCAHWNQIGNVITRRFQPIKSEGAAQALNINKHKRKYKRCAVKFKITGSDSIASARQNYQQFYNCYQPISEKLARRWTIASHEQKSVLFSLFI